MLEELIPGILVTDANTGRTGTVVDAFHVNGMDLVILESEEWGRWTALRGNVAGVI